VLDHYYNNTFNTGGVTDKVQAVIAVRFISLAEA